MKLPKISAIFCIKIVPQTVVDFALMVLQWQHKNLAPLLATVKIEEKILKNLRKVCHARLC
jgi:hypothetical protein